MSTILYSKIMTSRRLQRACFVTIVFLHTVQEVGAFCFQNGVVTCRRNERKRRSLLVAKPESVTTDQGKYGLYRRFADHAWARLEESGMFQPTTLPLDLQENQAPAKGMKDSTVRISTKAMVPTPDTQGLLRYARIALLETVSRSSDEIIQSAGIQVLNFVVIPSESTSLPVLGIDLVSLPGNKHLLLLDAQPMTHPNPFEKYWQEWHSTHVVGKPHFPWGGDFPDTVKQYVSNHALWTRLQDLENPVSIIENQVWEAFVEHLDEYISLLKQSTTNEESVRGSNHQRSYLEYRRMNDPAKPMLNSLYGSAWTDRVLDEVLFPPL